MQGGDLSNRLPARWLFVYEGVIANVPPERIGEYRRAVATRRWKRAAACWQTEPHVQKVIWDLVWRRDFRFDVVTFMGEHMAEAVELQMQHEALPFSNCWPTSESDLATRLAYMPDVQFVVHADPSRRLAYGNRGLLVTEPGALNLW